MDVPCILLYWYINAHTRTYPDTVIRSQKFSFCLCQCRHKYFAKSVVCVGDSFRLQFCLFLPVYLCIDLDSGINERARIRFSLRLFRVHTRHKTHAHYFFVWSVWRPNSLRSNTVGSCHQDWTVEKHAQTMQKLEESHHQHFPLLDVWMFSSSRWTKIPGVVWIAFRSAPWLVLVRGHHFLQRTWWK